MTPLRKWIVTVTDLDLPNYIGRLTTTALRAAMDDGDGFATFHCDTEDTFLQAAHDYAEILPHRDADPRGITHLHNRPGLGPERGIGFTQHTLLPHTDRPAAPTPPRVLLLWCRTASTHGGEATVLRAQDLANRLHQLDPTALHAFTAPDAAIFRTGNEEKTGPILTITNGTVTEVRLRFDPHVYFAADAAHALPTLHTALQQTERTFPLTPGKGYAIRNDLWLHGRRAYTGNRETLRIMLSNRHPTTQQTH
jgi:hypothetical protein